MRNVRVPSLILAVGILLIAAGAFAGDCVKVAPDNFKVLLENDEVRVLEYTAKKGEKVAMHSHPDHVIYALMSGKAVFSLPDGTTQDIVTEAGQAIFVPATTHATQHFEEAHVLMVELKKPMKK